MLHKQFGNHYVLRLEAGEEFMGTVTDFCRREGILLGKLSALGGMDEVTVGLLNKSDMQYIRRTFREGLEVGALFATITERDGEPYIHAHITVCDAELNAHGGHLFAGVVFPLLEVMLEAVPGGKVGRFTDPETGLILTDLSV